MTLGHMEYDGERRQLWVYADGNAWLKENAEGLTVEGVNLKNKDEEIAFLKAAAPGGTGLEKYGFTPMRLVRPLTV